MKRRGKFSGKRAVIAAVILILLTASWAYAREVKFDLSLSKDKIQPGRQTSLLLSFPAATKVPVPEMPFVSGLDFSFIGTSQDEAGRELYTYRVVPLSKGKFKIGPVVFEHAGDTYMSGDVELLVTRDKSLLEEEPKETPVEEGLENHIYLEVNVPRTEVFVNEKVPVTVLFYTDWLDLENLVISEAHSEHYITEKYIPGETKMIKKGDVTYTVLDFSKWFYVPEPGEFPFGPVASSFHITRAKAELLNNNEAFYLKLLGRRASMQEEIESDVININALPLPVKGRPDTFRGAVGNFKMDFEVSPKELHIGESLTITMTISGEGNYYLVNLPVMADAKGFSVYDPQVTKQEDSMIIRQTLRAITHEATKTPEINFSFFDPKKRKYETITQKEIPIILVLPKDLAEKVKKEADEKAALKKKGPAAGIVAQKASPGNLRRINPYFYKTRGFLFLEIFPLLLLLIGVGVKRRMDILSADTPYTRWLRASRASAEDLQKAHELLAKKRADRFYGHIFKMMQRYLCVRFRLSRGGVTASAMDRLIGPKIKNDDITGAIKEVLHECYLARYTKLEFGESEMIFTYGKVKEIMAYLNAERSI